MDKCPRASVNVMTGKRLYLKSGLLILAHNLYTHSLCINSKNIFIQICVKIVLHWMACFKMRYLRFCVYFAYGNVCLGHYQCHNVETSIIQILPVDTCP